MKKLYERYRHVLAVIVYFTVYMTWFNYIEKTQAAQYTVIHMDIDDKIPFCEYFIVPYLIWFIYVVAVVGYLMITDREGFYRNYTFLVTGMTIFLLVSTLFPNVQHLRPYVMPRDNVFARMVQGLYATDTPTNLWPSIHVYNSIGAFLGVAYNKKLGSSRMLKYGAFTLSFLIILSTLFLKQHSMFDVLTAFLMAGVVYVLVYRLDLVASFRHSYHMRKAAKEHEAYMIK